MKCEFGYTPNIECDECAGVGVFVADGTDDSHTPCYSCMTNAVHSGEVKSYHEEPGQVRRVEREFTLEELLPRQPHYFMLLNGNWYARYGMVDCTGLLVFTNLDQVNQLVLAVPAVDREIVYLNGCALAEFQPIRVAADDVLPIIREHNGQICVLYGRGVMVATITEDANKSLVAVARSEESLEYFQKGSANE